MEKKVYVKRYPRDRKDFRDDRPPRDPRERYERRDHGNREEREEFRKPPRPKRPDHYRKPFMRPRVGQKTKMFTSKEELVAFVNEKGEEGHKIDVYKIEDELYKVVIIERPKFDDFEEEVEVEVEIEE